MEIIFEVHEAVMTARLFGELDHHAAAEIRETIDCSLKQVFDFANVTYMDSSGIGVVLGRYRKLSEAGGSVAIAACTKSVRTILNLAGVFSLMPYAETKEEAVALLKGKEVS